MKKIIVGLLFLSVAMTTSSCGLFKKKCNCPHFEVKAEKNVSKVETLSCFIIGVSPSNTAI